MIYSHRLVLGGALLTDHQEQEQSEPYASIISWTRKREYIIVRNDVGAPGCSVGSETGETDNTV